MKNRESEEMYLETIFLLKEKDDFVRAVDIANKLGYAKSSVSRAVKLLVERGYVTVKKNGNICFTESGRERAKGVYERHKVLTKFFMKAGAERKLAEEEACKTEHVISSRLFDIIKEYVKNFETEEDNSLKKTVH